MIALAPRLELEQASLRLGIGTAVLVALMWRLLSLSNPSADLSHMVWFLEGFVAIALTIILWTLFHPHESPLRLILGIVADNAAVTYFMLLIGESGALVVGIYMFVAIGNGYRYGTLYLRISHGLIGVGMLIALIFLPLYVGVLAERLKGEWLRADEELKECREALKECRDRGLGGS
jgi:two-component system sensor histidine kinase RpfC